MITIRNYSERAIALTGDTKEHKSLLKNLGGKYNPALKCGAGWVFSRKKAEAVAAALRAAGATIVNA